MNIMRKTGATIPLGALRTKKSPVIGEYTTLAEAADFAEKSGFSVIQLLPIFDSGTHSSPYSALSAFAFHPIYINVSAVTHFKLVFDSDTDFAKTYRELISLKKDVRFDYKKILSLKEKLLRKIFRRLAYSATPDIPDKCDRFYEFIDENQNWIKDYCVFKTLKEKNNQAGWKNWKKSIRSISKEKIEELWNSEELKEPNYYYAWQQLMAFRQFSKSSENLRKRGIILKGDIPILLDEDSCDVWANPELFSAELRAGSPPDFDNPNGQSWGFPIYNWENHAKDDFSWWKRRVSHFGRFFDSYRLDHLPGFFRFWAIFERDSSADTGFFVPYKPIEFDTFADADFSPKRIKWLAEPHIPTFEIFRLTGNLDLAHDILSLLCDRIGHEELWNFKKQVRGEKDIIDADFSRFSLDDSLVCEIRKILIARWKNRTLREVEKGFFVPACKHNESESWNSLSLLEREKLQEIFDAFWKEQSVLQKNQAERIFSALIPSSNMIPCGENLGALPDGLSEKLEKFGIFGLKVVRWCRDWFKKNQPYEQIDCYPEKSVVTTSVHDSSTIREWWDSDKESVRAFMRDVAKDSSSLKLNEQPIAERKFSAEIAQIVLENCAKTRGAWFINPIQDWLYLDEKYYLNESKDERINVPGEVKDFNWTWRLPVSIEMLSHNEKFCRKIREIAKIHDEAVFA